MPDRESQSVLRLVPRWGALRWILVAVLMIVLGVALLPSLVCRTSLRHALLRGALRKYGLVGHSEQLRFGWITPLSVQSMTVQTESGVTLCQVGSIRSTVSLVHLLSDPQDLGTLEVVGTVLHLYVGQGAATWELLERLQTEPKPGSQTAGSGSPRELEVRLTDTRVVVHEHRDHSTLADVADVDLRLAVTVDQGEPLLTVQLDHPISQIPVTPELSRAGLRYAAPVLSAATWTSGTLSLELSECLVPLREPRLARVQGVLVLHDVTAGLQEGVALAATREISALTQRRIPESVRLANENRVEFYSQDGRVYHSGLDVGLPDVSDELLVKSSGSVGFDQTLDLELDVPLPFAVLGKGPLGKALGNQSLRLPVGGTLDEPRISFAGDGRVVSELIASLLAHSNAEDRGEGDSGVDAPVEKDVAQQLLDQAEEVARVLQQRLDERRKQREQSGAGSEPRRPLRDLLDRFRSQEGK